MNIKKTANLVLNFAIRRLVEIFGIFISISGLALFLALLTYSPDDPNFRRSRQLSDLPDDLIDQQALELARRFREKSLNPTQVRSRISKAVAASFDQRQTYQKAEAARMEQKLKSIQAAITKRETLRERIIARRVDELLNLKLDRVPQSPATSADR